MNAEPQDIGFFLVPGFSLMALSSASEPLRAANRVMGYEAYRWSLISIDGQPVQASSGFTIIADHSIHQVWKLSLGVVASRWDVADFRNQRVFNWLRSLAHNRCRLGAISTGTFLLARAGLLAGHRCTIHWELLRDFAEEFPEIELTRDLFCIDRNRLTCAGGTAALDLMLALISEQNGELAAADVAEQFLHTRIRPPGESQRMAVQWRYGITDRRLARAITLMEENTERPLSAQTLAQVAGISDRQLERLFLQHFGRGPSRFYLELRLRRAQTMLLQSTDSISQIAEKCGFASASHLGKCYREVFRDTPAHARRSRSQSDLPELDVAAKTTH